MISHLIAGATGKGKTTFVKSKLDLIPNKKSLFIYDINNEYTDYYNQPLIEFENFSEIATRFNNGVIVLEEATIFLNNRSCNQQIIKLLVQKRHNGNYIFLNFHSLRAIPRYIFDLSNYITVFKTNDNASFIANHFQDERIIDLVNEVKEHPDEHFYKTLKIN